jgi:hypothetical protein
MPTSTEAARQAERPAMIERTLEDYWTALKIYHLTLRTSAQKQLWLGRMLDPLVTQQPRLRLRCRMRAALEREQRLCAHLKEMS